MLESEYRYDTQLLIERTDTDLDEDEIHELPYERNPRRLPYRGGR